MAEVASSEKNYEYKGRKYSIGELCMLTGYAPKGLRAKINKLNHDIDSIVCPKKIYTTPAKLYECFGLTLRTADWAALLNTNKGPLGRQLKNGLKPEYVFRAYTYKRGRLHMDKFRAKFVSSGQPQPYAHKYTNFEIYTKEDSESTAEWAFKYLYPRRVPEMNEWLKNINDPNADITPDYYYKGYYQLIKEDYGYFFSVVEPYTD